MSNKIGALWLKKDKNGNMKLRIYGNPVAQGRPRAFRRGNYVGMYDPEKSKSWKNDVKWQAIQQKPQLLEGAVKMNLKFILERPKSLAKSVIYHVKRPDLDNLVKAIKDALRGICYKDDSQIVELAAEKIYTRKDHEMYGNPGVFLEIEECK